MFAITRNGVVTMDDLRFSALVAENLQEVVFFWGLIEESYVVALLTPDLAALALAPTTRYSYGLHYGKFTSNNRQAMPPDVDRLAIYFSLLALNPYRSVGSHKCYQVSVFSGKPGLSQSDG